MKDRQIVMSTLEPKKVKFYPLALVPELGVSFQYVQPRCLESDDEDCVHLQKDGMYGRHMSGSDFTFVNNEANFRMVGRHQKYAPGSPNRIVLPVEVEDDGRGELVFAQELSGIPAEFGRVEVYDPKSRKMVEANAPMEMRERADQTTRYTPLSVSFSWTFNPIVIKLPKITKAETKVDLFFELNLLWGLAVMEEVIIVTEPLPAGSERIPKYWRK